MDEIEFVTIPFVMQTPFWLTRIGERVDVAEIRFTSGRFRERTSEDSWNICAVLCIWLIQSLRTTWRFCHRKLHAEIPLDRLEVGKFQPKNRLIWIRIECADMNEIKL